MIRPATAADFNFIFGLYMHPDINAWLLYEPMSATDFRPVFDNLQQNNLLFVFETTHGEPAGMCKIVPQQYRNAHIAYLGGIAIHPNFAGKGFGKVMMTEIMQFIIGRAFKRVELSTAVHNTTAISLYEKFGFEKVGVLKKFTYVASKNEYWDEVMMAWVAED
jgi:RimJ/RimL family protein N-acetyltransferase